MDNFSYSDIFYLFLSHFFYPRQTMKNVGEKVKKDIIQQIVSVINTALISLQSLICLGSELSPGELQLNWLPVMFA